MLGEDDTVYADGYSDAAYRQIRRGSTTTEVRNLLGEPFETFGMIGDRRADDGWWYDRPESDNRESVVHAHEQGKRVNVWTVD